MEFLTGNPLLLLLLLCLCSPPGLLPTAVIWWLARRYNMRNPFTRRHQESDV